MTTQLTNKTQMVASINRYHDTIVKGSFLALAAARDAGMILAKLKQQVGKHGSWQTYVKDNFTFSVRTAQQYMLIAQRYDEVLNARQKEKQELSVNQFHKLLAESKPLVKGPATRQQKRESLDGRVAKAKREMHTLLNSRLSAIADEEKILFIANRFIRRFSKLFDEIDAEATEEAIAAYIGRKKT